VIKIVENWDCLEAYASRASNATVRAVQEINGNGKNEIRVLVGKYGFIGSYDSPTDTQFCAISEFCRKEMFLDVTIGISIEDEAFFQ
jgi:hypothetical protein